MDMKKEKVLLIATTMMLVSIPISVFVTSKSNIFTSGTGIIRSNNNRTFTLNTPLNIEGKVGTLNIGTLSVRATDCSALDNGVARLNNGRLIIYCSSGFNSKSYYYGFSGSSISELSLTYNNNNRTVEFWFCWGGIKADNYISYGGSGTYDTYASTASSEKQTKTFDSGSTYLGLKQGQVDKGLEAIYIRTNDSKAFDLYSLTITYTCR